MRPLSVRLHGVVESTQEITPIPNFLYTVLMDAEAITSPSSDKTKAIDKLKKPSPDFVKEARYASLRFDTTKLFANNVAQSVSKPFAILLQNRIELATRLSGMGGDVLQTELKRLLTKLGANQGGSPTSTLPERQFTGIPIVSDGAQATNKLDVMDAPYEFVVIGKHAIDKPQVRSDFFTDEVFDEYHKKYGVFVPRDHDLDEMGIPVEIDPKDYATLSSEADDQELDADARIVINSVEAWARAFGLTEDEMKLRMKRDEEDWKHLFEIEGYKPRADRALTSTRIRQISRCTIVTYDPIVVPRVIVFFSRTNPVVYGGSVLLKDRMFAVDPSLPEGALYNLIDSNRGIQSRLGLHDSAPVL